MSSKESFPNIYPTKVDLTNCDKEPIHLINKIQSHGVLISGHIQSKKITRCSENCSVLFNKKPQELLDTPIEDILSTSTIDHLFDGLDSDTTNYVPTELNGLQVDIIVHFLEEEFILDFEILQTRTDLLSQQLMLTKMVSILSNTKQFNALNDHLTNMIKTHFGYDRVMLYQFDDQWNGSVVAEAKEEHLQSWLGLHYPSTDIPVPARRLFYLESARMVADIFDQAVNIIVSSQLTDDKGIDLSKSTLRASSPIHIEYLTNMKVGATLTVPILFNRKVWGLIACHHYSAKSITYNERLSCKFLAKFFSNQVQLNRSEGLLKTIEVSSHIRGELINQIIESWNIAKGLSEFKYTLNDLTESAGAVICINNNITSIGNCPTDKQVLAIIKKVKEITNENIFHTNHFVQEFPEAQSFKEVASGVICVFISSSRNDALLWFKPEIIETVFWAGKPQDKSSKDKNARISPRKSFEKWKQVQEGIAAPWKENEIAVIKEFRKNVMNFVTQKYDEIKLLNNKLKKAYKELESFSYSVSHDLRAPLRGIDGFAQIIKEDYYDSLDEFGKSSIETIINSVKKMNMLIDDLLAYSSLDQKKIKYQKISITKIVEQEITIFKNEYPNAEIVFETSLPEIYGDPVLIILLIRNLLENALKYSSKEKQPQVKIGVEGDQTFYIQDNGIGFDQKNSEKIFKVFNRLINDQFKGSGIGLSIAKRIVDKHNGEIWAISELGKGATLYFNLNPKDE